MTQPTKMYIRQSPIQDLLDSREAAFLNFGGSSYAVRFHSYEDEQRTLKLLGLCDLSGTHKLGVKGPAAETWLASNGLDVPNSVFSTCSFAEGGTMVRLGTTEFFLEDDIANANLPTLAANVESYNGGGMVRVEHQEATFLLTGHRALEALAQTCGINFLEVAADKAVFTRVAGVSCGIFPGTIRNIPAYRLWIDPSFAVYAWETLEEICQSLGGGVIGAGCIYPELLRRETD